MSSLMFSPVAREVVFRAMVNNLDGMAVHMST